MMSRILIILISASLFAACSTSGPGDPGPNTTVRPGAGSVFVYRSIAWDTLGNLSEDWLDTEVVFKSGISYQGRDNVLAISRKYDTALRNARYFNYAPNGDIEDYYDIAAPYGWRTYPIASHGTASFQGFNFTFVKDSSIAEGGGLLAAADISVALQEHYWIAPSLGQMVRIVAISHSPYRQNYSRFEWHLVSYDLK